MIKEERRNPKSIFLLYTLFLSFALPSQKEERREREWSSILGFPLAGARAARRISRRRRASAACLWARRSPPISGRNTMCVPFRFGRTMRCKWWGEPTRAARARWCRSIAASGSSTSSESRARRWTAPPSTSAFTLQRLSSRSCEWTRTVNPCSIARLRAAPPLTRKRVQSLPPRISCRLLISFDFSIYFFNFCLLLLLLLELGFDY